MHTLAAQLSNHIKRTVTGPMWHGPALAEVLAGVTHEQAASRPVDAAHSIWEIVLHVAAWADIAGARLKGERTADPAPDEDWPPVVRASPDAWTAAVEGLHRAHRELATDVRRLDEAAIHAPVNGLQYTVSNLLHGVVEHGTYHGGQIALLKRALEGRRP
jgi:uncharacterized damage-inducible protein DinB